MVHRPNHICTTVYRWNIHMHSVSQIIHSDAARAVLAPSCKRKPPTNRATVEACSTEAPCSDETSEH